MKLDMNAIRTQVLRHVEGLWQYQYMGGGFSEENGSYVSIMGTTDAAWVFYMLQAKAQIEKYGKSACKWLLHQQTADGHFYQDIPADGEPGYRHSYGHALWMAVRALKIYGEELPAFPAYLNNIRTPEGLNEWFMQSDWQSPESNHHNVLGLIPTLVSHNDPEWAACFYDNLASQQDKTTFTWCDNKDHNTNVSRTFAYCAMHMAAGKIPPHAKELIDTILKVQQDSGIWENRASHVNFPEFHTMDACYILWRVGNAIGYPIEPRLKALNKAADALITFLVLVMFYASSHWNNYFSAMIYLPTNKALKPLQLYLREILILESSDLSASTGAFTDSGGIAIYTMTLKYAIIVVAILPLLIIFPWIQKYFTKGLMVGSLKG